MPRNNRICDVTAQVLRETDNPAVMYGDAGLLDLIAVRAGVKCPSWPPTIGWQRVLNALSRQPGELVNSWSVEAHSNRRVRCFRLPEEA